MQVFLGVMALSIVLLVNALPSQAVPFTYSATLTGANENPPNLSLGIGTAFVTIDEDLHTLAVSATFSGLLGSTRAAHIHCCVTLPLGNVGVATQTPSFAGFPLGVTSGTYSGTFDTTLSSSFNPTFITNHGGTVAGAEAALFAGIQAGTAYFNIHTTQFPAGEIRGFFQPVPEPKTLSLLVMGLGALAAGRLRRQQP